MEWFLPDASMPVRQGDIVMSRDPKTGDLDEACLVITADCDISKGKFGRQLACLRVLPYKNYVAHVWAWRKLDKAIREERKKLRAQIAKWHTAALGQESTLTEDAAWTWLARSEPEAICDNLAFPDDGKRKKFIAALHRYRNAFNELNRDTAPLTKFVALKSSIEQLDPQECKRQTLEAAQKEKLPEDVFLLPALPLAADTPAVVMLREIVGVSSESVCFRSSDADGVDKFLRIGRLHPTYKYAVSQAFGALYSRIGLPDEYEQRCKDVVDDLISMGWE